MYFNDNKDFFPKVVDNSGAIWSEFIADYLNAQKTITNKFQPPIYKCPSDRHQCKFNGWTSISYGYSGHLGGAIDAWGYAKAYTLRNVLKPSQHFLASDIHTELCVDSHYFATPTESTTIVSAPKNRHSATTISILCVAGNVSSFAKSLVVRPNGTNAKKMPWDVNLKGGVTP